MRPNIPAAILPFLPTSGPTPTSHNALFPPSAGWFPRAIGLTTEAWTFGTGPSWSAAIVNSVGGYDNNNHQLATNCGDRANTVVLIIWDDWGGWYDHVLPWRCNHAGVCSGYPGGLDGGASDYVYGFRVPLLVVSAYAARLHFPSMRPARTTELSKREAAIHPRLRQHPQLH